MLNGDLQNLYDIVLIQEPHRNYYKNVATARGFRQIYPGSKAREEAAIRSGIWMNEGLSTNSWRALDIVDSADITAVQLTGTYGQITIFNIYNDCTHDETLTTLQDYIDANYEALHGEDKYTIWAGDFNRHHPRWDDDNDTHLFTRTNLDNAQPLLDLLEEHGMEMALPKGVRTLTHNVTKRDSRPDNVFISGNLTNLLLSCTVDDERYVRTDHYGITTVLDIEKVPIVQPPVTNWRTVNWEEFSECLKGVLREKEINPEPPITTVESFNSQVHLLTESLQIAIDKCVPKSRPTSYARRWWNKDLIEMREKKKSLSREAKVNRAMPGHPVHATLRQHLREYGDAIEKAKIDHWEDFLTNASTKDMWTASGYLTNPVGDAGRPRIPTLKATKTEAIPSIDTNEKKAEHLAKTFFPKKPTANQQAQEIPHQPYEEPCRGLDTISIKMVKDKLARLSPYKAPGLDGIPNIVLQRSANDIAPILSQIYSATLRHGFYHQNWRESITCVLRKPGKPSYEEAKAYRPIALLSTIGKLLSAIIADDISRLIEEHGLLPDNHYGGRQGRTTTDALHYLVTRVKTAWSKKKVASVLFLDIEGAFPNAVTEKVLHNMRKRRIPEAYVRIVTNMLAGRRTKLKFDDYLSDYIDIDNGIGQGCPLSMILYIIYNADIVDIPQTGDEDAAGWVDDVYLYAEGNTFDETVGKIRDMMRRPGGGLLWSKTHNSRFEMSKVALMHFSKQGAKNGDRKAKLRDTAPKLKLNGTEIAVAASYKYLGVLVDPDLNWRQQEEAAAAKAMSWVMLFKRLARTTGGMNGALMRQLYRSVGIPKLTYAADVWYEPPYIKPGNTRRTGSVRILTSLRRIQRLAAIAITGALRSTAGDILDVHANLTPIDILMETQYKRSYIRLCTLRADHPLHMKIHAAHATRDTNKARMSPMQSMAKRYPDVNPDRTERIGHNPRPASHISAYTTDIAQTRQDSIETEGADAAFYKIYTDGSGLEGKAGAAALLFEGDNNEPSATRTYHLGGLTQHTTYEAEWVGVIMGLWLLLTQIERRHIGIKHISMYVDNQSVLSTLRSRRPGPAQHLATSFEDMADSIRHKGPRPAKFRIRWISAHSEVERNEKVDEAAKAAARGAASEDKDLPPALRQSLPASKSAMVQTAKNEQKTRWKATWSESPRQPRLERYDSEFPCKKYMRLSKSLPRPQAARLVQLRTGHFPLNDYLKKTETSRQ